MTPLEVLVAARELISDSSKWTQNDAAVTAEGVSCAVDRPEACKWCAWGALMKVSRRVGYDALDILHRAAADMRFVCAQQLNDTSDHETVMRMYSRAIELARAA